MQSGLRTDSGVGDDASSELANLLPYNEDDLDAEGDEGDEEGEDANDIVHPLPARAQLKRYEKKKRLGLQFLSSVTPMQMAVMAPTLKASMDHFINQLEVHMGVCLSFLTKTFSCPFVVRWRTSQY